MMAALFSGSEDLWDDLTKRSRVRPTLSRSRIPSLEEVGSKKEPKWTMYSGAQNLTTALNDPSCRELDLFTRSWGSYFIPSAPLPPSTLPSIQLADFLRYLKETASGRKIHRAIKRDIKKQSDSSTPASPADIAPLVAQLNEGGKTYDLSSVPRIYMQADFSLGDPPTFQEVIPLSKLMPKNKCTEGAGKVGVVSHEVVGRVNHSSKLLHEKLTHYLDIIEVHLAYQISQRSDLFFDTLTSQQDLQSLMMNVRHDVVELRHTVRQLDKVSTHDTLRLYRCYKQYRHYLQVVDKLKLISIVQQTQPNIQSLLATSDFVGALELITTTQEVLSQELQGVHALRHLGSQLTEMEKAICRMMESDFVQFCLDDIRERLKGINSKETTEAEDRLVSVAYGLLRQGKVHFLTALRESLLTFIKAQVKDTLSDYLQVTSEPGDDPPSIADTIRSLDFDPWMALLSDIFNSMITLLSALQGSLKVIADVCQRAGGKEQVTAEERAEAVSPDPLSPSLAPLGSFDGPYETQEAEDRLEQMFMDDQLSDARLGLTTPAVEVGSNKNNDLLEELPSRDSQSVVMATTQETTVDSAKDDRLSGSLTLAGVDGSIISRDMSHQLLAECDEVICASCDLIHARCAKILSIRAKAGLLENLISTDFVSLVRLVETFVNSSIHVTGRHCPQLRTALFSQARKFLEHFHGNRTGKLSLLLDGERWKQVEVPAEIQQMVSTLETGITPSTAGSVRTLTPDPQTSLQPPRNKLTVHGENFSVVGIVLLLVKIVMEYCTCADDLPMLTTDVMTRLIEILKNFNSRTCELVLGAGAMAAVGLKMITARHLALSTRCLEAVMLIVPHLKRHFQVRLSPKQHILLSQFDLVIEDISSHCRKIHVKVMGIMDAMILKQLDKWEAKSPVPSSPFKILVKQIVRLHDNLVDILPKDQLQGLFVGVEEMFTSHLRQKLIKLGITNNGSTQHGIVNSELSHFKGSLCSLEDVTAFGSSLFDVWTGLK